MDVPKVTSISGVDSAYTLIRKKYQRSSLIFIVLNVTTFLIAALTIILSIWAVRIGNSNAKFYFVGIAILAAISTFLMAVISAFTFGVVSRKAEGKVAAIQEEEKLYEAKTGDYADNATRFEAFIRKVTIIYNG